MSWQKFMSGLPTTPVHDLLVHPRDGELIAGTHGRSIWIADITPLQQMTAEVRAAKTTFFDPRTAFQWGESPINGGNSGQGVFAAPSPQYGASMWYRLTAAAGGPVRLVVQDASGDTLRTLTGPGQVGLHNVVWDMRAQRPAVRVALSPAQVRDSINTAVRVNRALDSLEKAEAVPAPMLSMIRTSVRTGQPPAEMQAMLAGFGGGGGGGFGGGQGGAFVERPGESRATPSFPTPGAAGAGGRGGAATDTGGLQAAFGPLREALGDDFAALGLFPGGGRGGRGGGAQNYLVGTGDDRVTIVVGGQPFSRLLHVEQRTP